MSYFIKYKISGGPIVDETGRLVGIISEADCMREISDSRYFNMPILAKVNKQESDYSWIYPNHEWQKINLIGFNEKDFEINEDLFLVNKMDVKHK